MFLMPRSLCHDTEGCGSGGSGKVLFTRRSVGLAEVIEAGKLQAGMI